MNDQSSSTLHLFFGLPTIGRPWVFFLFNKSKRKRPTPIIEEVVRVDEITIVNRASEIGMIENPLCIRLSCFLLFLCCCCWWCCFSVILYYQSFPFLLLLVLNNMNYASSSSCLNCCLNRLLFFITSKLSSLSFNVCFHQVIIILLHCIESFILYNNNGILIFYTIRI